MTATSLVSQARAAGLHLRVDEGRLPVSPEAALTVEIRAALTADHEAVIARLRFEPPVGGRLQESGRVWIPPPARVGFCPCDQERAHDPVTGLCRSCSSAFDGARRCSAVAKDRGRG